jgi:hypothetical protein
MKNQRNLFLDQKTGLFLIRLQYSKVFSITQREQAALRVLPWSISYMILIYLTLILPFRQFFEILGHHGGPSRARELLFYGDQKGFSSDHLRTTLGRLSQEGLGQRLQVSSYRHLIQGFIRYYIGGSIEEEGQEGLLIPHIYIY